MTDLKNTVRDMTDSLDSWKAEERKKIADLQERVEGIEALGDRPSLSTGESGHKVRDLFGRHLKALHNGDEPTARASADSLRSLEGKAMSGATAGAGGNLNSELLAQEILRKLRASSPLYNDCRKTVVDTSPSNYKRVVSDATQSGGWVAENGTRNASTSAVFNKVSFPDGMLYALVSCSEELVHGSTYNVAEFVIDEASRTFGNLINTAIWGGSGSDQPAGLVNTTPSASGDEASPERAFGTLMYLPTGVSGAFAPEFAASPSGDPAAVLYDTVYSLKPEYRQNGKWYMSGLTIAEVAKLRDADGRSLLAPQMSAGVGPLLLGYEIRQADHLPAIGAGSYSIAFGSLADCYEIVEGFGMRVTYDDNIVTPGICRWYLRRYLSGNVVNDDALRVIKFAAS